MNLYITDKITLVGEHFIIYLTFTNPSTPRGLFEALT